MSSTLNIQNYLTHCFRPRYEWNTVTGVFDARLELSNIDQFYGNVVNVKTASIGDDGSNVFVGTGAGSVWSNTLASNASNVAVGIGAGRNMTRSSNNVLIGTETGANMTSNAGNTVVGVGTTLTGNSNILLGQGNSVTGNNNLVFGNGVALGTTSNTLRLSNMMYGNFGTRWLGIHTEEQYIQTLGNIPMEGVDISGITYIKGALGINANPLDFTLNVNGTAMINDGYGMFRFNRDASDNTNVVLSNFTAGKTTAVDIAGTTRSTNGFFSRQGTLTIPDGDTLSIGQFLQKGNVTVTAIATPTVYATSRYIALSSTQSITLSFDDSNCNFTIGPNNEIAITNTSGVSQTFSWTITYFPIV